jgi:hypothetical protein
LTHTINEFNHHAFLYEQMKVLAAYNLDQSLGAIQRVINIVHLVGSDIDQMFTNGDAVNAASLLTDLGQSPAVLRILENLARTAPDSYAHILIHPSVLLEQPGALAEASVPVAGPSGVQSRPSSPHITVVRPSSPASDHAEPADESPHAMVTRKRGRQAKAAVKAAEKEKKARRGGKRKSSCFPFLFLL